LIGSGDSHKWFGLIRERPCLQVASGALNRDELPLAIGLVKVVRILYSLLTHRTTSNTEDGTITAE
jgi:hypothetical protein